MNTPAIHVYEFSLSGNENQSGLTEETIQAGLISGNLITGLLRIENAQPLFNGETR